MQDALIGSALEALLELTPADLISAIGTRTIAGRVGMASATVFHQFGSVAGFADAVVARVFDPGALPLEAMTVGIAAIKAAGLPVEAASTYHRSEFARLTSGPGLRLRMGLWSLGGGATDEIYRDFLRVTDSRLGAFLDPLWEHWGREIRPPFDLASYVAAQVALLNGLSIRHLVDPELSTEDNFALVATALTMTTLRLKGDQHDLADRISEMNYYPLRSARTGAVASTRVEKTRAALMASAATLFGSRGYEDTTVTQIARKAGVSTSSLYKLFGGKAALATALFSKQADDFLATRPAYEGAAAQRLFGHLVDVAHFVGDRTEHSPAYLSTLMGSKPRLEADPLLASTTQRVAVAVEDGGVAVAAAPVDVAQALLGCLIGRVASAPSTSAEAHVQAVAVLLLGGPLPSVGG